jgi:intracellular sulfur oxidation DsrE/DsrF family protein
MLGRGEDKSLGSLLMKKFLHTIPGLTSKPETILFINNGVKLVAEDSVVIGELKLLEENGIKMLACGTCLERFELADKIGSGRSTDMHTIANIIFNAEKVVSI